MGKSPDAFRTISEVADWLDTQPHVLRFWESKFTQVKPVKRAGGRRYYRPNDMMLLGGIKKLLHDDGMTIKGVQKILREQGIRNVSAMSPILDDADQEIAQSVQEAPFEAVEPEEDRGTVLHFQSPAPQPTTATTAQTASTRPAATQPVTGSGTEIPADIELAATDQITQDRLPEDDTPVPQETIPEPIVKAAPTGTPEPIVEPDPVLDPETVADASATDALTTTTLPAFIRRSAPPVDNSPEIAAVAEPAQPDRPAAVQPPVIAPLPELTKPTPRRISVPADLADSAPAPNIGMVSEILQIAMLPATNKGQIGKLVDQLDNWRNAASHRGV